MTAGTRNDGALISRRCQRARNSSCLPSIWPSILGRGSALLDEAVGSPKVPVGLLSSEGHRI